MENVRLKLTKNGHRSLSMYLATFRDKECKERIDEYFDIEDLSAISRLTEKKFESEIRRYGGWVAEDRAIFRSVKNMKEFYEDIMSPAILLLNFENSSIAGIVREYFDKKMDEERCFIDED